LRSDEPPEADAGDEDPVLRARDVAKHFGGIRAVDGMDIDVYPGELLGLIGPNGAGKTTFFNTIAGSIPPDRGKIWFRGQRVDGLPPYKTARRGLVRTFQLTRALERMSVKENLMMAPKGQLGERLWAPLVPVLGRQRIAGQEREIEERAEETLETFDLDHLTDEYAGALSGGQKKLLELARALMMEPDMLLLDEPMAGVNPTLARKLMDLIHDVREERGITILLIEHDMETVMENCERIVVMADGQELASGGPQEIQEDPEVVDAYLGD
jgi:branched-chain amino acid transport system ATP-binding protein